MNKPLVFGGMTLLAACACGAGAGLASISTALGLPIPAGWPYAALLTIGGLLVFFGIGPAARPLATAGLLALIAAGVLAPPSVMSDARTHTAGNSVGFAFYVLAAGLLAAAFVRHWRPQAGAALVAVLGGVALSVGCTCCLTLGAVRYGALGTGLPPAAAVSRLALVSLAVVAALAGFRALQARTAAFYFAAGVLLVYPVEKAVEALVPTWQVGGASLVFLLRYPVWLTGTALLLYSAALVLAKTSGPERRPATAAARAAT